MTKFFTSVLGFKAVCFDYAVVNPYGSNYSECVSWLRRCRRHVREVLVDTAVHKLFHDHNLTDYPQWYIHHYVRFIRHVLEVVGSSAKVYYAIPDIPVDYEGREFLYPYNVERTVHYIQLFLEKYVDALKPAVPVAVVQGRRDDVRSVIDTYIRYEDIYSQFELIGVGPTCHSRNYRKLAQMLLAVERTVSRRYHAFGIHYNTLKLFMSWRPEKFYSFDSTAYYWIGRRRIRNPKERLESLSKYLHKLKEIGVQTPRIVLLTT
ncbi:MAG: hypothetical protein DRO39_09125 [Thermoprotei archaeon]|nr:MAG: hypothetical protein DRO39_09125 [Thermoprotei archaeon]